MKAGLLLLVLLGAGSLHCDAAADAVSVEPIDDLQWLFIEDTVALISPPSAEVGVQARELMERAAAARASGALSEMRRALAQARVILAGGEWNAANAFVASLAIRPHETAIDSSAPAVIEIGQYFQTKPPSLDPITLDIGLRSWRPRPPPAQDIVWHARAMARSTDFSESPVISVLSFRDVADGAYELVVRASQRGDVLGTTAKRVFVVAHLQRDLQVIETRAAALTLTPAMQASIAYPADLVRGLNDRSRQVRSTDVRALIDRAQRLLDAAEANADPLTRAKGSVERHYWLAEAGRYEPFRLIVPPAWDGRARLPLVVVLHGSNGNHDSVLSNPGVIEQAQARGWAVLSPMGYSPNSGWGNHLPVVLANGTQPRPRPSTIAGIVLPQDGVDPEPAERDVLRTIALVRAEYPIDGRRIYLLGNSMGGEGTWHLAARFPGLWAAVAPAAGAIAPEHYPYAALGKLPVLAVHGQGDTIVAYDASRDMVERLERQGGNARLLRVIDGGHDAVYKVLPDVFNFFARHARRDEGSADVR